MDRVSFHRLAERELNDSALYYEHESPGLGKSFLDEIERYIEAIAKQPNAGTKVRGQVRRRVLRRFPYGILYSIRADGIRILAIMNLKRRPMYWVDPYSETYSRLRDRDNIDTTRIGAIGGAADALLAAGSSNCRRSEASISRNHRHRPLKAKAVNESDPDRPGSSSPTFPDRNPILSHGRQAHIADASSPDSASTKSTHGSEFVQVV